MRIYGPHMHSRQYENLRFASSSPQPYDAPQKEFNASEVLCHIALGLPVLIIFLLFYVSPDSELQGVNAI